MHKLIICKRTGPGHYHYKNWSSDFTCPACGKVTRHSLNFLGQRKVLCDGTRTHKLGPHSALADVRKAGLDPKAVANALGVVS